MGLWAVPLFLFIGLCISACMVFVFMDDCLLQANEGSVWAYRGLAIAILLAFLSHSAVFVATHIFCSTHHIVVHVLNEVSVFLVITAFYGFTSWFLKTLRAVDLIGVAFSLVVWLFFSISAYVEREPMAHKCVREAETHREMKTRRDLHDSLIDPSSPARTCMRIVGIAQVILSCAIIIFVGIIWSELEDLSAVERGDCVAPV